MSRTRVSRWAAWSPGLEGEAAWRDWARDAAPLEREGTPDVRFLPAMLRRRCDPLARMMLHVVNACCPAERRAGIGTVFASRHGCFETTVAMLEDLARDAPLSPTRFSHSVHNTQAGLFSQWTENREASTALAAAGETFAHGFLEAICTLHRSGADAVLLVCGDEPVPESLAPLADRPEGAYALALLLERDGPGTPLDFGLEASAPEDLPCQRSDAIAFLRWWLSGEDELRIARGPRSWCWRRAGADA